MITILYYNSVHNMDSVYSLQPNDGGSSNEYLVFAKYCFITLLNGLSSHPSHGGSSNESTVFV